MNFYHFNYEQLLQAESAAWMAALLGNGSADKVYHELKAERARRSACRKNFDYIDYE